MNNGRNEQEKSQAAVQDEIHFQIPFPAADLKKNQQQVDNTQNQDKRNSPDGHFIFLVFLFLNFYFYSGRAGAAVQVAVSFSLYFRFFFNNQFDFSGKVLRLRPAV